MRMARYLFRILVLLSSLLFVGSVAMWVRSEWKTEIWSRTRNAPAPRDDRGWSVYWATDFVASGNGGVRIGMARGTLWGLTAEPSPRIVRSQWAHRVGRYAIPSSAIPPHAHNVSVVGLRVRWWHPPPNSFTTSDAEVEVRYWLVALLAGVVPLVWVKGALREHARRRRGLCTACGYDLRGSTGRCPECGTAFHFLQIPLRTAPPAGRT